jgi:hypothetical protein
VTTVTIERKSSSSDLELLKTPISEAISDAGLSRSIPRYSPGRAGTDERIRTVFRAATLPAHTQTLLRSKTVDLALDGEQNIDAPARTRDVDAVRRASSSRTARRFS